MISIDGITWDNILCSVERVAEIEASEISGMLLDKSYFNDVLGTWLRYTVDIAVPFGKENDYILLYEKLTEPVDGHTCVLPYNNGTITITARIETVSDVYVKMPDGSHWRKTKFECIANHPSKNNTLSGVITRGLLPFPGEGSAQTNMLYMYNGSGWEEVVYADADNVGY